MRMKWTKIEKPDIFEKIQLCVYIQNRVNNELQSKHYFYASAIY